MKNKMKLSTISNIHLRRMNKKGFLLLEENSINLVLAVIGLVLVLVVIFYLFNAFTTNQVKRNAQTSLDILETKANSLGEGESAIVKLPGLNRVYEKNNNWFIAGWSKDDTGDKNHPERYFLKSIICVCKGEPYNSVTRNTACQKIDSCREIKDVRQIIIELSSYTPSFGAQAPTASNTIEYPAINFASNLIEVEITKNNGVVTFKKKV